jgi:hypothetical protein
MGVRTMAKLLEISPAQCSRLGKMGMPVNDLEAATAWRKMNLDPSWMKQPGKPYRPARPTREVDDDFEVATSELISDLLRRQLPPLLWRVDLLAVAATEAGIAATPEKLIVMGEMLAVLLMAQTNASLDDGHEEDGFALPPCLKTFAHTAERDSLRERIALVIQQSMDAPLRG